jgi:hypothetical protein
MRIWLDRKLIDWLLALRRPGEAYSDIIMRLVEIEARQGVSPST